MLKAEAGQVKIPLCLIVDGGGTFTRCQVFSCLDGALLGLATADGSNATVTGLDYSVRTILSAVSRIGHVERPFAAVWCGISGADDPATCLRLHGLFLSFAPDLVAEPQDLLVTNDCDLLASAVPLQGAKAGITLIAGTGSNAMAFRPSEDPSRLCPVESCGRVGGWGHVLGDEGSAYWLGREALRGVLAHRFDTQPVALELYNTASVDTSTIPSAPSQAFIHDLLELLACRSVDDLLTNVHTGTADEVKGRIASISPLVTRYAFPDGDLSPSADAFASDIVGEACNFHARAAHALLSSVLKDIPSEEVVLILGGAVFHGCPPFAEVTRLHCQQNAFARCIVVDDAAKLAGEALTKFWRERQAEKKTP